MKKYLLVIVCTAVLSAIPLYAVQLVSVEQAVSDMFASGKAGKQEVTLTAEQIKAVNAQFGEELIGKAEEKIKFTFYSGAEGNAMLDAKQGKWGEIQMIFLLDKKSGKIINLEVLASSEKRGRPIVMPTFLKQFKGKGADDKITVGKTINAVSGATISSDSVSFMAKRAIAVHKQVMIK